MTDKPVTSARRARRQPRLLAVGDLVLDVVARPGQALSAGTDVPGSIELRTGGSAANTARAFAALGGEAAFLGAVGDDGLGRRLVRSLRAEGVRVHAPATRRPTARLVVLVDPRGERSFVTQRGAADHLRRADVPAAAISRADAIHLPAYSLVNEPLRVAALHAIARARQADRLVSIDLASRGPLLAAGRAAARRLIAEAAPDVLFANHDEARALTGDAPRRLLELAPIAVIKEGAAGCRVLWLATADSRSSDVLEVAVATAPLKVTDTTGAGDAFDAGFLHSLLEHALASADGGQQRRAVSGADRTVAFRRAQVLRRAAMAGHRAAAGLLTGRRRELEL